MDILERGTFIKVISMKAIRPIYDGKDDLEYRTGIDPVDMMVCLFSETTERIKAMEDINDDEKAELTELTDWESLPEGIHAMKRRNNDDSTATKSRTESILYRGTEFDEIIVLYEIIRWMRECGYRWSAAVPRRFKYTAQALGILPVGLGNYDDTDENNDYIIHAESKSVNELKLLLPLHWATILLDWRIATLSGIENREAIRFGVITIS